MHLDKFWKASRVVREIDCRFLADLANSGNWTKLAPDLAIAMVQATLSAPANFVQCGVSHVFSPGDLNTCQKTKLADVKLGQAAIMQFRALGERIGVTQEAAWSRIEGAFASRVVMYTFSKKSPHRKVYQSVSEAAVDSFADLTIEFPNHMNGVGCPWHVVPIADARAKVEDNPNRRMQSVASGGTLTVEAMATMGYKVGIYVRKVDPSKQSKSEFMIKGMVDASALVVPAARPNDTPLTLPFDKLIEYQTVKRNELVSTRYKYSISVVASATAAFDGVFTPMAVVAGARMLNRILAFAHGVDRYHGRRRYHRFQETDGRAEGEVRVGGDVEHGPVGDHAGRELQSQCTRFHRGLAEG